MSIEEKKIIEEEEINEIVITGMTFQEWMQQQANFMQ